jgi:hypothetical protein
MFYEAMLKSGVGAKLAKLMYLAVYYGGPRWDDLTIRNSKLLHPDRALSGSVASAISSARGNLAVGDVTGAQSSLNSAESSMQTDADQYAVADVARAISIKTQDMQQESTALDAMISSGIPDAAALSALLTAKARVAMQLGNVAQAADSARAAVDLTNNTDAVQLLSELKRNESPAVEGRAPFEANELEFKRLSNLVEKGDLDLDQIDNLVDAERPK